MGVYVWRLNWSRSADTVKFPPDYPDSRHIHLIRNYKSFKYTLLFKVIWYNVILTEYSLKVRYLIKNTTHQYKLL